MRLVVYGAGAVGSVLGARLYQSGAEVVLVARPAHAEAIRAHGLRLITAEEDVRVAVPAVTSLDAVAPGEDDIVLITAKTQDTPAMHEAIGRWNAGAAVVCGTNGVEHERLALRRFADVYAMVIQLPSTFEHPGEVMSLCHPTNALVDVGRYPSGVDSVAEELAAVLAAAPHVSCEADPHVMAKKYAKLLVNLGNATEAACGERFHPVTKAAMTEAKAVYEAAGISYELPADAKAHYDARLATMQFAIPDGATFTGGSTWQGLAKGSTTTETDYFNGEIVLLGRLHGVPTPHNEFLQRLVNELIAAGAPPASMSPEDLDARWRASMEHEAPKRR
jgi:2-dehydropantoate 2-reductase